MLPSRKLRSDAAISSAASVATVRPLAAWREHEGLDGRFVCDKDFSRAAAERYRARPEPRLSKTTKANVAGVSGNRRHILALPIDRERYPGRYNPRSNCCERLRSCYAHRAWQS